VARLHRNSAYLVRHAALASRSDPSGALDGLSRCHPVVPNDKRSQAHIPGTHEVGMEGKLAVLAHKKQPVIGTVLPAGVATTRASLVALVGIHADAATACQGGFVGQQSTQFGKGPAGGMPIRLAGFGRHWNKVLAEASAVCGVSYAREWETRSSRPIKLWGWVSRRCLAMV
jgi:hypothetical protein